ncbi:MAG: COQ9 family protein [Alphaproteobacteria bacterium]|nr:COQ9 family protein [Alphaproteobacteria bacterium]
MSGPVHLAAERRRILAAALPHVPFDGWSERLLADACREAGLPADMAARAFPRGLGELVDFYLEEADRAMVEAVEQAGDADGKLTARVKLAIRLRLERAAADKETVRRTLAFLSLPQNAPLALSSLYRTVDAIWYAVGDTATDFSFYTKRLSLAAIYSATLLYWLDDRSEGASQTMAFLDRRIADLMRIGRLRGRLRRAAGRLPDPFGLFRNRA